MKHDQQKQKAGVWLDNTKAIIIAPSSSEVPGAYAVSNKINATELHAGGSEHAMNHAKQSELLKYYRQLSNHLVSYDEILVFGPGKAQEQFQNHLEGNMQFKNKKITVDSSEQLTTPQMIAKVTDFFSPHQA